MLINETPPSVRRIETDRDDAYAFEVTGQITASDMENMYGLLEGAYELHPKIDVIVIIHDYEGLDWAAVWRSQTISGKARALKHIRKCAIVGGPGWIKAFAAVFGPFTSATLTPFALEELEEAWEWIGAKALPSAS